VIQQAKPAELPASKKKGKKGTGKQVATGGDDDEEEELDPEERRRRLEEYGRNDSGKSNTKMR